MTSYKHPQAHRQFTFFLLTGVIAAAVNFSSRIIFSLWMPFGAAILVAYFCGMLTAFILNRTIVFTEASNAIHHQVFWFTIVNLVAAIQTLAVSLLLAKWLFPRMNFTWHAESVAHAFGVGVPIITSFVGHKRLSFRGG